MTRTVIAMVWNNIDSRSRGNGTAGTNTSGQKAAGADVVTSGAGRRIRSARLPKNTR
jgi:hypothetical protein